MLKPLNKKFANPGDMHIKMLIEYILSTNHSSLRKSLDVLPVYLKTIATIDKNKHPETVSINDHFQTIKDLLTQHLDMEKQLFFPYVLQLSEITKSTVKRAEALLGLSKNPIIRIKKEHTQLKSLFHKIRKQSNNYNPADDASPSLKLCYAHMFNFEQDIHKHIFLEEFFLFPKIAEMEQKCRENNF